MFGQNNRKRWGTKPEGPLVGQSDDEGPLVGQSDVEGPLVGQSDDEGRLESDDSGGGMGWPPRKRFLSQLEYKEQGRRETAKALERLRVHCKGNTSWVLKVCIQ